MPLDGMAMAVRAYRTPAMYRKLSSPLVFRHMLTVIKVAAGDDNTLAEQSALYRMRQAELQEAAKNLLLHQLLKADSRGNRLLGLPDGATPSEIKDHKRWLLKWLHPDRNPSAWEQKLFHRVNDFRPESQSAPHIDVELPKRHHKAEKARKGWSVARSRQRDASPRRLLLKTLFPLMAAALCSVILVLALAETDGGLAKQMANVAGWFK